MKIKNRRDGHLIAGFTMIEVLVFIGVFAGMALVFITILITVMKIQVRQTGAAVVTQESQFLLKTIERYVQQASLIDLASDTASTTLKLRMASSSADPTYIYLSGTTVYLKETDAGTPQELTSSRVATDVLTFVKRTNPGGHDAVSISLALSYNTTNLQRQFNLSFATGIRRVSAATFDSNLIPSVSNTYRLGVAAQDWQSINNTLFFSGSNVGIGISSPAQTLEVNGGVRLNTTTSKPSCSSSQRGTFWVTENSAGTKDNVEVCVKNASDTYMWATIY